MDRRGAPLEPEPRLHKHTWLGRIRHENAAVTLSKSGKILMYTGHDQEDQSIYKLVSSDAFDPSNRATNLDLLTDGTNPAINFPAYACR